MAKANERQGRLQAAVEDACRRLQRECQTPLGVLSTWGQIFCDHETCSICRLRHDLLRAALPKEQFVDKPPPLMRLAKDMKRAMLDEMVYVGEKFDPIFTALSSMTTMSDSTKDMTAVEAVTRLLAVVELRAWQTDTAWGFKEQLRAHLRKVGK